MSAILFGSARRHRPALVARLGVIAWFTALGLFIALTGCSSEKRVPVFPVSGKVSYKGEAPAGAQVTLHPVGSPAAENIAPIGTVKDDGTFRISVYGEGDGAPAGEYVATVQWFKVVGGGEGGAAGRGPNVIPQQYSDPKSSPIKVTVAQGPTEIPPIEIK